MHILQPDLAAMLVVASNADDRMLMEDKEE